MPSKTRNFTGSEAKKLMQNANTAALSTLTPPEKHPFVSLVTVAIDASGGPVVLISELAWHTKNLVQDNRAALLFDNTHGLSDPLTGARVTAIGVFEKIDDPAVRKCFLSRHPDAAVYSDFSDFSFWRMEIEKVQRRGDR